MKVVINACYGGYGLSQKAIDLYVLRTGLQLYKHDNSYYHVPYEEYAKELEREQWLFQNDRENYRGHPSNRLCWTPCNIPRDDNILINIIQELGPDAAGEFADLKIVDIPDDTDYTIQEYDGTEWITEKHRKWYPESKSNSVISSNIQDVFR
jgi:hypothetical protein